MVGDQSRMSEFVFNSLWHNILKSSEENFSSMKRYLVNIILLTGFLTIVSCEGRKGEDSADLADEQNEGRDDFKKDAEFAVDATDAGLYEIQMATLAKQRAYSSRVKEFAEMMVTDHTKANNELRDLAGGKGIALPDVMCEDCQKKYYDLDQKTTAGDFDNEYMDLMVKDHRDLVDKFEKEAGNGNDAGIRAWASSQLPILRHHLQEAENIRQSVGERNN